MNLYEITSDLEAIENDLLEAEGEASEELLAQYFEALENRDEKLNNYGKLIRKLEVQAEMRQFEAKRLSDLASADKKAAERLKERLKFEFQRRSWSKIETTNFKFSLAKNGGKLPLKILISDPNLLPDEYRSEKVVVSANTEAIRKALEEGEELEFAELGERGESLRIK